MKQKILVLLLSILFSISGLYAQKETYNRFFGTNTGLNFLDTQTLNGITGVPTYQPGPINTDEGCFSISDRDGNFLFASDGRFVYNKHKSQIVGGFGLLGHSSSAQSGIVIPVPESSTLFYIVTVSVMEESTGNGLNYSIIDIGKQSGDGEVIMKTNL